MTWEKKLFISVANLLKCFFLEGKSLSKKVYFKMRQENWVSMAVMEIY